jgi:GTP cyclohydrolase IB
MIDIQAQPDHREIPIDHVGVNNLRCPIVVLDRQSEKQRTIGQFSMSVSLPKEFKGTHMSRFIEILNEHKGEVTMRTLPAMLSDLRDRLAAETARVEVSFPYFVEKAAPVTGSTALMDYECEFIGEAGAAQNQFTLSVTVPVTSLCPCSKAISDYGAHNQRGFITIAIRTALDAEGNGEIVWIEEMIAVAEASASAPVYPLVKRPDERHITMQAFDNPVFVEDMVRNVAAKLMDDRRVTWFRVEAENDESIHNHNAFARIEWARPT